MHSLFLLFFHFKKNAFLFVKAAKYFHEFVGVEKTLSRIEVHMYFAIRVYYPPAEIPRYLLN
jgi:hypothetical protein